MSRLLTTIPQLREYLELKNISWQKSGLSYLDGLESTMPLRISTYYADLIDWNNTNDPLRLIAIPSVHEETILPNEVPDPIGDEVREAAPGLIHRYPDRCLLLLTTQCRIHCRFCFRRDVIGKDRPVDVEKINGYIIQHDEIQEVIFSGGDPFTLNHAQLENVLSALAQIPHVKRIRFHTRVPAIDPDSVPPKLLEIIRTIPQQVVVVLHVDHSREVTEKFRKVVVALYAAGCMVLSQSVLLKGVNDSVLELANLFTSLANAGVKPYYLHHLDQAQGISHFRHSIETGLSLFSAVSRKISPLSLPRYVLDLPGGYAKVPINELRRINNTQYSATTFEEKTIIYTDPAA